MNCAELVNYWDSFTKSCFESGHESTLHDSRYTLLQQLFSAYTGSGERAPETDMILEPYLGDIRRENLAKLKLVMLNLNPGSSRNEHQALTIDSTFGKELETMTYSEWAASWPYLNRSICRNWGGPFHQRRIVYAEELLQCKVAHHEVLAFEIFPWHSSKWGKLDGKKSLASVQELVLEPLSEIVSASGAFLIAFGKPWQEFAETIGKVTIQNDLSVSQKTGNYKRRFLQYCLPNDIHLNLLINTGYAGPPRPRHPDVAIIRDLMFAKEVAQ